jgi:hypothetical protein
MPSITPIELYLSFMLKLKWRKVASQGVYFCLEGAIEHVSYSTLQNRLREAGIKLDKRPGQMRIKRP